MGGRPTTLGVYLSPFGRYTWQADYQTLLSIRHGKEEYVIEIYRRQAKKVAKSENGKFSIFFISNFDFSLSFQPIHTKFRYVVQKSHLHPRDPSEKITKITRAKNSHFSAKTIFRDIFVIFRQKFPIIFFLAKPPSMRRGQRSVCQNWQKRNLAGNLNTNFGAKIQTSVFPVSGLQSSPNFTGRRSWGTCARCRNPRSIISTRSKVIQEKRFSEIAKIGFLRSEGHKIPTAVKSRETVAPTSYPHWICVRMPNLKKIVLSVFEQIAAGTTH